MVCFLTYVSASGDPHLIVHKSIVSKHLVAGREGAAVLRIYNVGDG